MRRIGWNTRWIPLSLMGILSITLLAVGCSPLRRHVPDLLPLKPPRMTPESVVLDMFFVRFPLSDEEINGPFWNQIDEQKLSPQSRQLLAENGFRAGVISGPLPVRLSQLLQLKGKTQVTDLQVNTIPIRDLEKNPTVTRSHLQLRSGRRGEIETQKAQAELPAMVRDVDGKLSGQTLYNAQPKFAIHTKNLPDGRVQIRLTPEIEYGQMHREFRMGSNGIAKFDFGRDRKSYSELEIITELGLGDFLVLSNFPVREGSLGSHFFTEKSADEASQKLLIIRLSQTQHDDQFD